MDAPIYEWTLTQHRGTRTVRAVSYRAALAMAGPDEVLDLRRSDCVGFEALEGLGSGTLAAMAGVDGLSGSTLACIAVGRGRAC